MPEQLRSIDQIVSDLRGESTSTIKKLPISTFKQDVGKIKDITYDVPTNAIYDRLSDGNYVARFENYAGAVGNEDRLAQQQSWYEQAGNGILKNARKMGNYFLDATVGTLYGVVNAIGTGSVEGFYDNDFSNTLDDWNKQLDYKLPNYYSDEQKSQNFLSSMFTSNFWFNDVAGGLAFVGGAILPEVALGFVTGGASIPGSFAKFGLKKIGKELVEEALDPTNYKNGAKAFGGINDIHNLEKGVDLVKGLQRTQYLKKTGDVLNTGLFLARTSGFEAGMEARHNFKDAMSEYFETFEDKNGRQPTFEEIQTFSDQARKASNVVFASNMAILAVSNAAMFGKAFNVKLPSLTKGVSNFGNKIIGLGVENLDDATLAVQKATRLQKFAGNTYKVLGKASIEGIYEEGLQGVAGQTMQNYLRAQYDPEADDAYGMMASLSDAFAKQYGSKEGWKEMGIGMIIGYLGSPISKQGWEGIGRNSRRVAASNLEAKVGETNKGVETLRAVNRAQSVRNFRNIIESKADKFESTSAENAMMNMQFIKSQEHLKTPNQIQQDFETVIDHMQLDEQSLSILGPENIDQYKESLKTEFKDSVKDYQFAKNSVAAIPLETMLKAQTPGQINEVREAMTMNIYMGKKALTSAKNIASQIETITGQQGIFDAVEFYNNLSQDKKQSVIDVRKKQRKLEKLEQKAVEYGQRVAGIQFEGKREFKQPTLEKRYNLNAEKLVLTQQEIIRLQTEIADAEKALEPSVASIALNLDGTKSLPSTLSVSEALTQLDQIDAYKESLRSVGKDYEADSLDYLVNQFKVYSDAHREMSNMARRMVAGEFFESKEGKNLTKLVLGEKYKMSEDMKKALQDNSDIVSSSLELAGISGYKDVQEYIQNAIEDNPDLSDREKFKVESILRLQLGVQALSKQLADINQTQVRFSSEKQGTQSPLQGDTIVLKQRLNITQDGLNNIDFINSTIDKILTQIEFLRDDVSGASRVDILQQDLENLEKRRQELLDSEEVEPEFEEGDYDKVAELATSRKQVKADKDAVEKSKEQEQEGGPKSDSSEYQGTEIGQQEAWQIQRGERETTESEANYSDRNISSQERQVESIYDSLQKFNEEIDRVINQRIEKYGVEVFDIFYDIPKRIENTISRAEQGVPTDVLSLSESVDYLYKVYKRLTDLKKPSSKQKRVSSNMTIDYIVELQTDIEQTLNHLLDYEQAYRTGLPLPKIEYSSTYVAETINKQSDNKYTPGDTTNISEERVVATLEKISNARQLEDLQLAANYPKLLELLLKSGKNPINDIDAKIDSLETKIADLKSKFKIVDSEEYIRLNELMKKKETSGLSDQETFELSELEDDINQWLLMTGTVADGIRLSDLIRQKVVLENTQVAPVQEVKEVTLQELLGGVDIGSGSSVVYMGIADCHGALFSSIDKTTGQVEVKGMKYPEFRDLVGFDFSYSYNKRGNLLIPQDEVNRINSTSNIGIDKTNVGIGRNYSVVVEYDNLGNGTPIDSSYKFEYRQVQDSNALYNTSIGDGLILEIDPQDDYNKELLSRYKQVQQTSGVLDEDQIAELEDSIHTQLIATDKQIKELESQASNLRTRIIDPENTTARKAELRKELTKVEDKITKREDNLYKDAVKQAKKQSLRTVSEEDRQAALDDIKQGLVIRIKDIDNNHLGVYKSSNRDGVLSSDDIRFMTLRNSILSDPDLIDRLANVAVEEQLKLGVKVGNIYLGYPNFNFVKNEDGSKAIEYKRVSAEDSKKVVDLGYISKGKITTRTQQKGINTTFIERFKKNPIETQIPFIVVEQGKYRVAYPVRVMQRERPDNSEFSKIFNSSSAVINKVTALNKFMAQRGIDITLPGNAFYSNGGTNLTQDFFSQKLAQLESIEYFYSLEDWVDLTTSSIEDIVQQQVLVNVNMAKPFHSPKLQMDISEVEIEVTAKPETESKKKANRREVMSQSVLLSLKARDAQIEAENELNEDC